ncbi:MAG: nuclease, partial [Moritella sp.]|nr:nuclease [Moritella sp.]
MLGGLFSGAIGIMVMLNAVLASELWDNQQRNSCVGENSTISQLQGEGRRSPLVTQGRGRSNNGYQSDEVYTVQGVVTRLHQGKDAGFFMQQTTASDLSLASRGIFVSTTAIAITNIKVNTRVCVTGVVAEYYGMTRLQQTTAITTFITTLGPAIAVQPTNLLVASADANFSETLERYEGMKVRLVDLSAMRVSKPLYYDRRWQRYYMLLSHQSVNIHPNSYAVPGSILADQHALDNQQRRLGLQLADGLTNASQLDYIRVNDSVSAVVGIITFSYGEFSLLVDHGLSRRQFKHLSDREMLAPRSNDNLRIA